MKAVKLKDVIRRANTKVDKDNTYLLYYVGGEHFDSGSVRVKRYGEIAGSTIGPMFYYGFRAGQFLLVSRNPHLKKAGVVNIDGICSEKTFVLETKDETVLLKEFLPFILQNDRFWKYAITHGHGSTNKFINWTDLAEYEFYLPDVTQQKRIADLLWCMERAREAYLDLIDASDALVQSQFVEMFGERFSTCRIKLEQIATSTIGLTYKPENTSDGEGTIVLRSGNIQDGELDIKTDVVRVAGITIPDSKYVHPGDILMCSRNGSANLVGKCCRISECKEQMAFGAFMTVIRSQYPSFLYGFFQSQYFKEQLTNVGTTSINQITTKMLNAYETIIPTMEEEKRFSLFLTETDKSKLAIRQALESLEKSRSAIMTKVFG